MVHPKSEKISKSKMQGYFFTFTPSVRAKTIEYASFVLKKHHLWSIGTGFIQIVENVIVVNKNPCITADVFEKEKNHFFYDIGQTAKVTPLYPWNHPQDAVVREAFLRHYHDQVAKEQEKAIQYFGVPPPPQLKRCEGSCVADFDVWPEAIQDSEELKEWMAYAFQQNPGPPTLPIEDGIYELV